MRNALTVSVFLLALGLALPAAAQTQRRAAFVQGQEEVAESAQLCPPGLILLTVGASGVYSLEYTWPASNETSLLNNFFEIAATPEVSLSDYTTTRGMWTVQDPQFGRLEAGTLDPGESYRLEVRITGVTPGNGTLTLTRGADQVNPETEQCAVTVEAAPPDIVAQKRDQLIDSNGDGAANPGERLVYEIEITNFGGRPADAVVFTDAAGNHPNTTLVAGSVTTTRGQIASGNGGGDTNVRVDVGVLDDNGDQVTITFDVLIADPLPPGVGEVTNQGRVIGDNIDPVLTDDPDIVGLNNPTVTAVRLPRLVIQRITPTAIPVLAVDESVVYTVTVVGENGAPVAGAVVDVNDGLRGSIFTTPPTNVNGRVTYETVVPAGTATGRYTLGFVARAEGFDDSAPVNRQVDVVNMTLTVEPTAVDFGLTPLGDTASRLVTLGNTGQSPLTVDAVRIAGAQAGDFTLPSLTLPFDIAPGGSTSFSIRFTPGSRGLRSADLEVDSNGDGVTVPLAGQGAAPGINVAPDLLDYGLVDVGTTADLIFTITNTGNADLTVAGLGLAGSDAAAFAVVSGGGQRVLEPGSSHDVGVRFAPQRDGTHSARLDVANDATDDAGNPVGPVSVSLMGEGMTVEMPALTTTPTLLQFGAVVLGTTSGEQVATIANTGNVDLNVQVMVVGQDAAAFAIVRGETSGVLTPTDPPREIALDFTPTRVGVHAATVRILWNGSRTLIPLRGNGIPVSLDAPQADPAGVGAPVGIRVAIPQGFAPTTQRLFFRLGGETAYRQVDLQDDAGGLSGMIPAEFVTERGLEYYVLLENDIASATYPEVDPATNPVRLRVAIALIQAGGVFQPAVYRMVSVPLELQDRTIQNLIDDYGPPDATRWRVLRWRPGAAQYEEAPRVSGIGPGARPGLAAWLITRAGQAFDVADGLSVDTSEPYEIVLPPGWIQIANPFAFPVSVTGIGGLDALQGPYFYDGTEYQLGASTLAPWEGYFVLNPATTPVTLTVPPVEAGLLSKQNGSEALFPEADFVVQLRAALLGHRWRDTHNYVGFADAATARPETFNLAEPPPIGDYLRLSILNDGNHYVSLFAPTGEAGRQWDLEIEAVLQDENRYAPKTVRVALAEDGQRPDGYGLYVFDRDLGRVLPIDDAAFDVVLTAVYPVRHLSLVLGTAAFAEAHSDGASLTPTEYVLEANYPNPFNPETVIRYGLAQQSAVELAIYNVLGQRVRTLVEAEQPSGQYEVVWDGLDEAGRPAASGVYVYKLRAGGFLTSRTMLLVR